MQLPTNLHIDIPKPFRSFLDNRGLTEETELSRFLFPRLSDLPSPERMADLPEAADLVVDFICKKKEILIWGDYDVDGTAGTALLVNFLREYDAHVSWHIPHRFSEGYGVNSNWFLQQKHIRKTKDFLLITVDCGISNKEEIKEIMALGGRVIVTDHHRPPENGLPDCLILNPALQKCGFFGEQLSGAGVAFYLAAGIRKRMAAIFPKNVVHLKKYLAFVALGTIADVVELSSTNRILVRAGMEALSVSTFPGLQELLASSGLEEGEILSEDIAFILGPKLNAAGRLGDSELSVALLTEEKRSPAKRMAGRLSVINEQRKVLTAEILESVVARLSGTKIEHDRCIVIDEISHQGIAGIIASKLVELYNVPSLVFAKKELSETHFEYVGSARSTEGVDILHLLRQCAPLLERCGGHAKAAGLTVAKHNFMSFSQKIVQFAKEYVAENRAIKPSRRFDIECPVESLLSEEYITFFKHLEPFGPGNNAPIFFDSMSCVVDARTVGRDSEHLQVSIRGKLANLKGIGFGLGKKLDDVQRTPMRPILYSPTLNRFRGSVSWQIRIIDI